MKKELKSIGRRILKKYFAKYAFSKSSYAQEAEDLVVERLVGVKEDGFYVEVGCHHPFRFSNTYLFYKKGWRGVCIDPLPGTKMLFNRYRPRDTCIETGVNLIDGQLTYYMFNESALNTFDEVLANQRHNLDGYKIIKKICIPVRSLADILNEIKDIPKIDIMSVDVEGLDLQVLQSNDWGKFSPSIIIAECLSADLSVIQVDPLVSYLTGMNYKIYAKTGNSIIFHKPEF